MRLKTSIFFAGVIAVNSCGAKPPPKKPLTGATDADASAADVELTSPFALACDQEMREAVYGDKMNEAFSILCAGDKRPSGTFVKTLAAFPWTGENDLKVYRIGNPEHDNASRTTKLTGGGTVEISISPREYALDSHTYASDPSLANEHGIKLVDGLKLDQKISHAGEHPETGLLGRVTSRLLIEKVINHQQIVIEYEALRTSMRASDDVYITSTQMTRSIQGLHDLYSIGIAYSLNGRNMVTNLIMTKTDNRNQPGVAAEALMKTFREGIQNVRSNAIAMDEHDTLLDAGRSLNAGRKELSGEKSK